MNKSIGRVIVRKWGSSLLVRSLRGLWCLRVGSGRLAGIGRRVWVVHEVALRRKACSVLLVLLLAILKMNLLSALGVRLEDGVWEGGGGGGMVSLFPKLRYRRFWLLFSIAKADADSIDIGSGLWYRDIFERKTAEAVCFILASGGGGGGLGRSDQNPL
jgi:hypothetical protein